MNQKSIYKRTTLATFVSVLVAFTILSFVYFSVMNDRVLEMQSNHIYNLAFTLKEDIERSTRYGQEQKTSVDERIDLMAASSSAYIWLVRRDGIVVHASELPAGVIQKCRVFESGLIQLPLHYSGDATLSNSGMVLQNSEFTTLFSWPGINWITVILPVHIHSEADPQAILQVHYPFSDQYNWRWFFTNGMGVVFIVALLISVALTIILMNYIAAPLEALAEAAHRVTLGDYSVRVDYGDLTKYRHGTDLNEVDEMAKLVMTFNEMVERLDLVNMEQRDMISGISHDMKTPLTSIIGFTEGILDGTIPPNRQQRYLDIIRQEALRLKNLLTDMDQERLIEDRGMANFNTFSINDVFVRTLDSLEKQIQEKNLQLELCCATESPQGLEVIADEEQIGRVVYNLVSNAVKFCRQNDTIRITTLHPQGSSLVRCMVEDSGPGIPEENRNQVFGRFYKLDKSRGNREGSGLGLYLCRKTLAQHGQQIFVNESPDLGGARFIFTLPFAHPQADAKTVQKSQNKKGKSSKKSNESEGFFGNHRLFSHAEKTGAHNGACDEADKIVEIEPLVFTSSDQTFLDPRKSFMPSFIFSPLSAHHDAEAALGEDAEAALGEDVEAIFTEDAEATLKNEADDSLTDKK